MVALGFSAGLPYFLIFDTLSAWFRASGLSLEVIGFFSLVTLVSTFKFLWAPFVDRARVPVLTGGWGIAGHGCWSARAHHAGLLLVAVSDPTRSLGTIAVFALIVGFASATQDIAIDAWRIEAAECPSRASWRRVSVGLPRGDHRRRRGSAAAGPVLRWNVSYGVMAALMAVGVRGARGAARAASHHPAHSDRRTSPAPARRRWNGLSGSHCLVAGALVLGSGLAANAGVLAGVLGAAGAPRRAAVLAAWASGARVWVHFAAILAGSGVIVLAATPLPGARTRPGVYLLSALADPLRDFFSRHRSAGGLILALICLYRVPDFVLNIMNPFYLDLGYTLVEIAEIRKIFGVP